MTAKASQFEPGVAEEVLIREHPGHYAEAHFGHTNARFHWEWYDYELKHPRLCVVAPRDYAKTEVFSVISTCWYAERWPGSWQYIFSDSLSQAKIILERVVSAMTQANPRQGEGMVKGESTDVIFANYSRVTVAGVGKRVRTVHPDRIVGDDVLNEQQTATQYQRSKTDKWWSGTIAGMAHTGVKRPLGWGKLRGPGRMLTYQPTTIRLVGTPFHTSDLLLTMAKNRIYRFYRYAASFNPDDLIPGTMAVEAS